MQIDVAQSDIDKLDLSEEEDTGLDEDEVNPGLGRAHAPLHNPT